MTPFSFTRLLWLSVLILPSSFVSAQTNLLFSVAGREGGDGPVIINGIYSCPADSCDSPVALGLDSQPYAQVKWDTFTDQPPSSSSTLWGSQWSNDLVFDNLLLDKINPLNGLTEPYFHVKYSPVGGNFSYYQLYTYPYSILPVIDSNKASPTISMAWAAFVDPTGGEGTASDAVYTLGINSIDTSNQNCVGSNTPDQNFVTCTTPTVTLYNNCTQADRAVSPRGCEDPMTNSSVWPAANGLVSVAVSESLVLYFMTVLVSFYTTPTEFVTTAELWVSKDGDEPSDIQRFSQEEWIVDPNSAFCASSDTGSTKFRYDENGIPIFMCRSLYNTGITCGEVSVDTESGKVDLQEPPYIMMNASQVQEYCVASPETDDCEKVVSGFLPIWNEDAPSNALPETIYFGCFPDNIFVGAFYKLDVGTGLIALVVNYYNPGSILLGLPTPTTPSPTSTMMPTTTSSPTSTMMPTTTPSPTSSAMIPSVSSVTVLSVLAPIVSFLWR